MSEDSSLRSSLDSNDNEGPVPVQITEQNAPKTTFLRRFSSATQSFFSTNSKAVSQHQSEAFDHDIVGSFHLSQSLGAVPDEESSGSDLKSDESVIQAFAPQELQPFSKYQQFTPSEVMEGAVSDEKDAEMPPPEPLRRRQSTVVSAIQNLSQKFGFWDKEFLSHRNKIFITLFQNYLYILVGFTIALCVYWGVYYDRPSRYKNIKFAVVLGESTDSGLQRIVAGFFESASVQAYGNFDMFNYTRISGLAEKHNISISDEVVRQVHHQHYRAAFYVHENASLVLETGLKTADASFSPSTDLLSVYYETGSDYNAVSNYISSIVQQLCIGFFDAISKTPWTQGILANLNDTQVQELLVLSPNLLTELPNFRVIDGIPVEQQVVQAPLQIGLIYLCIFTFFQFMFTMPIQMCVVAKLKGWRFVVFRILTAQSSYLVLSLSYVALNSAFGIPTNKAFGDSGFLVVWAIAFLTMSSVGSIIEILVLVCVVLKPAMIGLVLLMVAVSNLAPTINPIYLCPTFYRYGYAMPVYNSYHLLQVALFNSWKGHFGRYIGVLIAWSCVTNCMMPFAMKWVARKMEQKRVAAAATTAVQKTTSYDVPGSHTKSSYASNQEPVTTSAYAEAVTKGTEDLHRERRKAGLEDEDN